jgi:hypothetical protein
VRRSKGQAAGGALLPCRLLGVRRHRSKVRLNSALERFEIVRRTFANAPSRRLWLQKKKLSWPAQDSELDSQLTICPDPKNRSVGSEGKESPCLLS